MVYVNKADVFAVQALQVETVQSKLNVEWIVIIMESAIKIINANVIQDILETYAME